MSKLTVTIPDDLHQQIRDELERQGITTSQFIKHSVWISKRTFGVIPNPPLCADAVM